MSGYKISTSVHSHYAPLRYEATRPYALSLGKKVNTQSRLGKKARLDFIKKDLLSKIRCKIEDSSSLKEPRVGPVQAEHKNIQIFSHFLSGGKVIFDFHKILTAALKDTDIDNIPVCAIPKIADALYLHFGNDSTDLSKEAIEGAFVCWSNESLVIDFVSPGQFSNKSFWLIESGELMTSCIINVSNPNENIMTALEMSIINIEELNKKTLEQMVKIESQLEKDFGEIIKVPPPISSMRQNLPLLKQGLTLLVNCLLYLGSVPEDIDEIWDERCPKELIEQALYGEKNGTRKTAERTLVNSGYIKIKLIGKKFAKNYTERLYDETGRKLATHFRRGHFRNQRYGKELSSVKVIFIPPAIVNPGQTDQNGKIYEV